MLNLSDAQIEVSNAVCRVELAKAGIVAYAAKSLSRPEEPSRVVGVVYFASGQEATLNRSWGYWSVHLSEPFPQMPATELNEQWFNTVRVRGMSGGTDVPVGGVWNYHVDNGDGLAALITALKQHFGPMIGLRPSATACSRLQIQPESLTPLRRIRQRELAAMEVQALLGWYEANKATTSPEALLHCLDQAQNVACNKLAASHYLIRNVHKALATACKMAAAQSEAIIAQVSHEQYRHDELEGLCQLLQRRQVLLKMLRYLRQEKKTGEQLEQAWQRLFDSKEKLTLQARRHFAANQV